MKIQMLVLFLESHKRTFEKPFTVFWNGVKQIE